MMAPVVRVWNKRVWNKRVGHRRRFLGWFAAWLSALLILSSSCADTTGDQNFGADARVALKTYTALVEQHLSSVLTALATLAATKDAASGRWDRIRPALTVVSDRIGTDAAGWFVRPDGSYFTVEQGLTANNLSDRAYFPRLMAGQDVEGDLVVSKSTGQMSCIIAAPVRAGGKVVGGLGASIDMVKVAKMVSTTMTLPPNMVFYALDSHGKTALHGETANIFDLPSEMGSASLRTAVRKMLESPQGTVSYTFKGSKRTVLYMRSRALGWTFALGKVTS